jgi:hypothetical protein
LDRKNFQNRYSFRRYHYRLWPYQCWVNFPSDFEHASRYIEGKQVVILLALIALPRIDQGTQHREDLDAGLQGQFVHALST